jgi:quinol monooxygenase YgiN
MATKLTVERRVVPGNQDELADLLRELRSGAVRQPGFISGETVIDAFNPTIFMTISAWSGIGAWQEWERNPSRQAIVERINALLQGTPMVRVWVDSADAPPAAV